MKIFVVVLTSIALVNLSVSANATLIDKGVGMIYDTDLGVTWLQDANSVQKL